MEWSWQERISIWTIIIKSSEFRWSLRVWRFKHSGHLVVKQNWQFDERQKICTQFLSWLRSSVVRASDRQSEDPSSIPGGAALCLFHLIQLSVHICRIEKERSLIRWNGPDRHEFRFASQLARVYSFSGRCSSWYFFHVLPTSLFFAQPPQQSGIVVAQ